MPNLLGTVYYDLAALKVKGRIQGNTKGKGPFLS